MSSFKLSLLSAFAAVGLVSAWCHWMQRERHAEAHGLRVANAALQQDLSGLPRAEPPLPAAPPALPSTARGSDRRISAGDAPTRADAADYRFQGQATPIDTLQTMAWAMDRGDVELMMKVITFDAPARTKLESYRAALPPEARAHWPTADALAATLLTDRGIQRPYPRADLLARGTIKPIATDRVQVRLPGTPKDRELYQKVGDEWKWVITEDLVDAYLQHVALNGASNR